MKKIILIFGALLMTQTAFSSESILKKTANLCEIEVMEILEDEGYTIETGRASYRIINSETNDIYYMFKLTSGKRKATAHVDTNANCGVTSTHYTYEK